MTMMRFPLTDDGDPAAEERSNEVESATPLLHAPDPEPEGTVGKILAERRKTHGPFSENARVSQALKRVMQGEEGWDRLTDVQREAIQMVALKLSRILTGDPNVPDHWLDVGGYAARAAERVRDRSQR